ncbi:MAG: RNA polymerase sigma factor [Lachnospiraceae bacterium]|nr:RNA polymerase sigma factor [Lachnospiraceae bacterium]
MKDSEIVELYWERNEGAIRETQQSYQRYLMKIAMRVLGNESDAEECVNDTYLAAWDSMPENRPERLDLYLAKIVRAKAIDRLRYNSGKKRLSQEYMVSIEELNEVFATDPSPEDMLDSEQLKKTINDFLLAQPMQTRKLFLERYFFFSSLKEVASDCGMSESKAKSILFRTRKKLKTFLEKEGFVI